MSTASNMAKKKGSSMSMASQATRRSLKSKTEREEAVARKIAQVFEDRNEKITKTIIETMEETKFAHYKQIRKEGGYEVRLTEIEKDRYKIKRKKNKKERKKLLFLNTIQKMVIINSLLTRCFRHYKKMYFESDDYRVITTNNLIEGEKIRLKVVWGDKKNQILKRGVTAEQALSQSPLGFNSQKPTAVASRLDSPISDSKKEFESPQQKEPQPTFNLPPKKELRASSVITSSGRMSALKEPSDLILDQVYKSKKFISHLMKLFDGPFKDDRKFVTNYVSQLARDSIESSEELLNQIFYDRIYKLIILESSTENKAIDDINRKNAFNTLLYMMQSPVHRVKLVKTGVIRNVFDQIWRQKSHGPLDMRSFEQLSKLALKIAQFSDLHEIVQKLDLLTIIFKMSQKEFQKQIRINSLVSIMLLTYNKDLFQQLIARQVLDMLIGFIKTRDADFDIKEVTVQTLVHFALEADSIRMLIDKNVISLFEPMELVANESLSINILTDLAWLFATLCIHGIQGSTFLDHGITRDMFLLSCEPQNEQIRNLVNSGFQQLGKCSNFRKHGMELDEAHQKIKGSSVAKITSSFHSDAKVIVSILLNFTVCSDPKYQLTAYWALKDYLLLIPCEEYVDDISDIIVAFTIGVLHPDLKIQFECATALQFLISQRLCFNLNKPASSQQDLKMQAEDRSLIIDAVLYLTGTTSTRIKTIAFSILSQLTFFAVKNPQIHAQIKRDTCDPRLVRPQQVRAYVVGRLNDLKSQMEEKFKQKDILNRYSGLFSILRLSQEPTDLEINNAIDKYISFVNLQYFPRDPHHVRNESYFIKVFHSLMHSRNPAFLQKMLKIINFYINCDDSKYQKKVIDPQTILWMLEVMEQQKTEKYLCCLTAATLLSIVSKHEIHFHHQEVAIIKKFNVNLQSGDVNYTQESQSREFGSSSSSSDSETEKSLRNADKEISQAHQNLLDQINREYETDSLNASRTRKVSGATLQEKSINSNIEQILKLDVMPKISEEQDQTQRIIQGSKGSEIEVSQEDEELRSKVKTHLIHASNNFTLGNSIESEKQQTVSIKSDLNVVPLKAGHTPSTMQFPLSEENLTSENTPRQAIRVQPLGNPVPKSSHLSKQVSQNITHNLGVFARNQGPRLSQSRRSSKVPHKMRTSYGTGVKKLTNVSNGEGSVKSRNTLLRRLGLFSDKTKANKITVKAYKQMHGQYVQSEDDSDQDKTIGVELVDPNDQEMIEIHMRDSLIKSFMVIFTNEMSQHLLLNRDLIDIAFNSLEFCQDCSLEAKRHVSRLISIIFKFPQVQERLLAIEVVHGICDLLRQTKHMDIVRNTIKACSYISMNYEFISSEFSLEILKAFMALLEKIQDPLDQSKLILTIKNILKGDKVNKLFFLENGGTQRFTDIIMESTDHNTIEMCINSIAEQASCKKFLTKILSLSFPSEQMKQIIQKCLDISDQWIVEMVKDEKVQRKKSVVYNIGQGNNQSLDSNPATKDSAISQNQTEQVFHIPQFMKNDLNQLDQLQDQPDGQMNFQDQFNVGPLSKIRKSILYLVARGLKFGFDVSFLMKECFLGSRLIKDLQALKHNHFIFQDLLQVLNNVARDKLAVVALLEASLQDIVNVIFATPEHNKRISVLKELINLILEASDELAHNQEVLQKVLEFTTSERSDDDMVENVLWMATSLLEQNQFNDNFSLFVSNMMENYVIDIIEKCLNSSNGRIVLQTLKLATKLSYDKCFRSVIPNRHQIMNRIKSISQNVQMFETYSNEIQTAVCQCLDKLSTVDSEQQRLLDFSSHLIRMVLDSNYKLLRHMQVPVEKEEIIGHPTQPTMADQEVSFMFQKEMDTAENTQNSIKKGLNSNQSILDFTSSVVDDIERVGDCNIIVENAVQTLANLSIDPAQHLDLLRFGIFNLIKKFLADLRYFARTKLCSDDGIEIKKLSNGTVSIFKAFMKIIQNLSENQEVHSVCTDNGLIDLLLESLELNDYEIQTGLFVTIGNFLVSNESEVRKLMVRRRMLAVMIESLNLSRFFKIKRICREYLSKVSDLYPNMFELNDIYHTKHFAIRGSQLNSDLGIISN